MVPHATGESSSDPPEVGVKSFAKLDELRVGVKVYAEKTGEKRRAEILSITQRKGQPSFYVHYEDFNKRLDEWIHGDRIDLSQEVEWPVPEKQDGKKDKTSSQKQSKSQQQQTQPEPQQKQKNLKGPRTALGEREASATPDLNVQNQGRASQAGGKENRDAGSKRNDTTMVTAEVIDGTPQPEDEQMDLVDVQDAAAAAKAAAPEIYSREEEIEKLRTGGSMTQNQAEISRVRNLSRVQMGGHDIEPWYFSPYPSEFTEADVVYICEFCLEYYPSFKQFSRHRQKCTLLHPPGNEIYRDDVVSFFEIDGRRQRTWCRNLCLLSKLFLDHKTLYYDVDPFLFYCMCTRDPQGCHLVGYFSKEKESLDGYNVACILTLPQYQRKSYGRLLIAFSYELSKREGKLGSPEKPLSDLGLLGYRAYWREVIVEYLIERKEANVEEISAALAMTNNDVLHTLQNLNMLKFAKNQYHIVLTDSVLEQRDRQKDKESKRGGRRVIDPDRLVWKPPVFTASSRTWNW